jgi:hypothetical protein
MIGSLVNFHQHKIWGKPLIPELVFNKRDKEKSQVLQKQTRVSAPGPGFTSAGAGDVTYSFHHGFDPGTPHFPDTPAFLSSGTSFPKSLRAPPTA